MLTFETLPVLLISAATKPVAASVILDLVDLDVTADYDKDLESTDRVWRLLNKYYSADVRVHALADGEVLTLNPHHVEAHIIYLTEEESRSANRSRAHRRTRSAATTATTPTTKCAPSSAPRPSPPRSARWARRGAARGDWRDPSAWRAPRSWCWPSAARLASTLTAPERAPTGDVTGVGPSRAVRLEGPKRLARAEELVLALCRAPGLDADSA